MQFSCFNWTKSIRNSQRQEKENKLCVKYDTAPLRATDKWISSGDRGLVPRWSGPPPLNHHGPVDYYFLKHAHENIRDNRLYCTKIDEGKVIYVRES